MSKAARQRSARERLAEQRQRQTRRDQQVRALMISLVAIVVLAVVVGGGIYFYQQQNKRDQVASAYKGPTAPTTREADGSLVMAAQGVSAPLLEIFEDFQCPICKGMEEASGATIKKLAAQGKVKVVYRPFQLFQKPRVPDPQSSNSQRAANAALCAPAPQWVSYHDTLFKFQPQEGSAGFAAKDLVSWGKDVGITDPGFAKCVTDLQKKDQLAKMSSYALGTRKVEGTPTVYLNGKSLDLRNVLLNQQALEQAILSAAKTPPAPSQQK